MVEGSVETIIARCLLEPEFLEAAAAENNLRAKRRTQFPKTELERIRRFAGFICKVQHNYLWESFSATRRLLRYYGLELDVFTSYRDQHLRAKTESVDERIRRFINFLDQHLSAGASQPFTQMLLEVSRHERLVWEGRADLSRPALGILPLSEAKELKWPSFKRLSLSLNPQVRVHRFIYDVESIVARLTNATFDGHFRRGRERLLVYCKDHSSGSLQVMQLDRVTAHLLSLVNEHHSVRAVIGAARATGLDHARPLAFRGFFEEAAQYGFVNFFQKRG